MAEANGRRMSEMGWGSDAIAALLRDLNFGYVALNPGASYRGLHDSLVNYNGNENPQMLLCLHEEHAIAMAHGYAKVTGKPLLTIVHSNVGLMHASMAIFNAYCDRMPIVILGATGPVDANKRRPWIDWIHTAQDQAALVRPFIKWDDQPASVPAALESIVRAWQYAQMLPCAPVYVCLDSGLQESKLDEPVVMPDLSRFVVPDRAFPSPHDVDRALALLKGAKNPVILAGRVSRRLDDWNRRVAFAEALNAKVVTDNKSAASFPTDHPLHAGPAGKSLEPGQKEAMKAADVILNLDFNDFGGALRQAFGRANPTAKIITTSLDRYVHNGWSMDHQTLPPADIDIVSDPDAFVEAAITALGISGVPEPAAPKKPLGERLPPPAEGRISLATLARAIHDATTDRDVCYMRLPLGMHSEHYTFRHPLDHLGADGGGGIGSGPGMAVGAALALRGTGRMPIAILGDGDFLMANTAFWTAVGNAIPMLVIIANNHSYFNDEVHQEKVAITRGRPVERKWIGQRIEGPIPDIAGMARAQGAVGFGPVTKLVDLDAIIAEAVKEYDLGKVVVVDVLVNQGYDVGVGTAVPTTTERFE